MKTGMLLLLLEEGVLHPRRQRFQLKKKMLRFFFFVELEVAARIWFLGELNGIFFRDRLPSPLGLSPAFAIVLPEWTRLTEIFSLSTSSYEE